MVNPYINFVTLNRPRIVKQNPNLSFGDISRKLGDLWWCLTDYQRKCYRSCHYDHKHDDTEATCESDYTSYSDDYSTESTEYVSASESECECECCDEVHRVNQTPKGGRRIVQQAVIHR